MVRLWDVQTATLVAALDTTARTARPLHKYRYKSGGVAQTAFSPDGTLLVTRTLEGTVCLWDAGSGRFLSTVALAAPPATASGHEPYPVVFFLEFSADGRMLLLSAGGFFNLWDVSARTTAAAVPMGALDSARLSPSGHRVVISGDEGLGIWDAAAGRVVARFETPARSAFFSPDDSSVISVDHDATVKIWPLEAVTPLVLRGHKQTVHSVEFSPDARRIVTASADKMAKVWEAGTGRLVTTAAVHDEEVMAATFSPEGTRVLTIGLEGRATITTPDTDVAIGDLVPPEGGPDVVAARFVAGGGQVVSLGRDRAVRVWGAASAAQQRQLPGKVPHCEAIAPFSFDGRLAFTVENEQAKIWNTADGSLLTTLPGEAPLCAAFSPDGRRLLTARGRAFAPARLWDTAGGRLIGSFEDPGGAAWVVAFSPDSRLVATAFAKAGVHLRDVESGRLLAELDTGREVRAVSFGSDGRLLVTAGRGGARLWDSGRGVLLAAFAEGASLLSAAISPDGTRLATAGEDAHAMVWPIARKDRSPAEVRRLLSCYVPWVLENGALVSRASTPAGCSVEATAAPDIRQPAP
jgi:WD40 repeat protein